MKDDNRESLHPGGYGKSGPSTVAGPPTTTIERGHGGTEALPTPMDALGERHDRRDDVEDSRRAVPLAGTDDVPPVPG
jgi:hypothetical protein